MTNPSKTVFHVQEIMSQGNKFDITILSATTSKAYVPNKDLRGCPVQGSHWANFLVVKIKVSNIGDSNYQISSEQLERTDCSEVSSFMNMYSLDVPGSGPYYKYERCLSDTNEPKIFSCSNMGISAGNFHISTLWIEISETVATSLSTAGEVVAHFLPLDIESKATSSPYVIGTRKSWSLKDDFSITSNPNQQWSYGFGSGHSFQVFSANDMAILDQGFYHWYNFEDLSGGAVAINNNSFPDYGIDPGEVTLESDLGVPCARWTSPYTATFTINVQIGGATAFQSRGSGNKNAILGGIQVNGIEQEYVSFDNNIKSYSLTIALNFGDTVDTYVGQSYISGNTMTKITITLYTD